LTIDAMRKKGVSETLSFFCFTHTYIYMCVFDPRGNMLHNSAI
jgi:hypothetical protein